MNLAAFLRPYVSCLISPFRHPRRMCVAAALYGLLIALAGMVCPVTQAQTTNEWTWMNGGENTSPEVYGTLGTSAAGNTPGGRSNASSWTDSSGNFWLFGGMGYGGIGAAGNDVNELWRFNPATNEWTWMGGSTNSVNVTGTYGTLGMAAAGNVPGARDSASSWTDHNGNLWLFGGEGFDAAVAASGFLNDLWKFDPSTNEWAWMSGNSKILTTGNPGVYGTLGTASASNVPGGRVGASTWTDASGNLWLFGGYDGQTGNGYFNDLWKFNTSSNEWTWVGGSSTVGVSGVYGTLGVPAAGNMPGARSNASSWTDASGNFWLFGGGGYDAAGTDGNLNDLWKFNPSTGEWTWVAGSSTVGSQGGQLGIYGTLGTPASGNTPGGRFGAMNWIDRSGNLWLFGGSGYLANGPTPWLNDLWEFDLSLNEWIWMGGSSATGGGSPVYGTLGTPAVGNMPGARSSGSSWTDSSGNLWLFGGIGYALNDTGDLHDYLNDLWRYQLSVESLSTADTPTISLASGTYTSPQMVAISDTTTGATIYYTTNGSTPTTSSIKYTGAILVSSTETLEAIATASGYSTSNVATANYNIGAAAPLVTLSPSSLTFASLTVGSTSSAQTVMLANSGAAALSISSIKASGDFAESNTCGNSVAVGANCAISVTFTPTSAGSLTGALTITDNAGNSPQSVSLSGTGSTVTVSSSSPSLTVSSSGGSATATIQLTPTAGFTGTANLTCSVSFLGQGSASDVPTCSLNPSQVNIANGTAASTILTINTIAAIGLVRHGVDWKNKGGIVAAFLVLGLVPRRRKRRTALLTLLCILAASGVIVGCSGGGSTGGSSNTVNPGTTAGSYNVTVTATSGTTTASTAIPLSVQ